MSSLPNLCSEVKCESPTYARDFCKKHYNRKLSSGELPVLHPRAKRPAKQCQEPDCTFDSPYKAKGMCRRHYFMAQVSGDPRIVKKEHTICTAQGCDSAAVARSLCYRHYQNELFNNRLTPAYDKDYVRCSEEGCSVRARSQGLCFKHHYEHNKDFERVRGKEKYHRDVEKSREQGRVHGQEHRKTETYKKRLAKYYAENQEKYRTHRRTRRARVANAETEEYTEQDVIEVYGRDCFICKTEIDFNAPRRAGATGWERGLHLDHHIPLSKGGTNLLSNMRPTHGLCNYKKGGREENF